MARCTVKNWLGESVGEAELELSVARPESSSHVVYMALRRQMTNARQGNAHTKTRSEVRGGGRKPWRQKGTGRARAGSTRSPLLPKGGIIFGPRKREYNLSMNRKERRLALRTALQDRADDLIIVEGFEDQLAIPKTREVAQALARWGVRPEQKVLLVVSERTERVERASRNLAQVKLLTVNDLNVYDLLHADVIVMTQDALDLTKRQFEGSKAGFETRPVEPKPEDESVAAPVFVDLVPAESAEPELAKSDPDVSESVESDTPESIASNPTDESPASDSDTLEEGEA